VGVGARGSPLLCGNAVSNAEGSEHTKYRTQVCLGTVLQFSSQSILMSISQVWAGWQCGEVGGKMAGCETQGRHVYTWRDSNVLWRLFYMSQVHRKNVGRYI